MAPDTFSDTEGSGIGNEGTFRVPIHESFWFEEIEEVGKDVNLIFTIRITPSYNNLNRIYDGGAFQNDMVHSFSVGNDDEFEPEYGPINEYKYILEKTDRKRLMLVLADLEYILVRATQGQGNGDVG